MKGHNEAYGTKLDLSHCYCKLYNDLCFTDSSNTSPCTQITTTGRYDYDGTVSLTHAQAVNRRTQDGELQKRPSARSKSSIKPTISTKPNLSRALLKVSRSSSSSDIDWSS